MLFALLLLSLPPCNFLFIYFHCPSPQSALSFTCDPSLSCLPIMWSYNSNLHSPVFSCPRPRPCLQHTFITHFWQTLNVCLLNDGPTRSRTMVGGRGQSRKLGWPGPWRIRSEDRITGHRSGTCSHVCGVVTLSLPMYRREHVGRSSDWRCALGSSHAKPGVPGSWTWGFTL